MFRGEERVVVTEKYCYTKRTPFRIYKRIIRERERERERESRIQAVEDDSEKLGRGWRKEGASS